MSLKIPPVLLAGLLMLGLAALSALALWMLAWRSGKSAPDLGLVDGRLRACPSSPNCVSSEAGTDEAHRVETLPAGPSLEATRAALRAALVACGAQEVAVDEPSYLRATFRTSLFGFVDDLELRIDQQAGHVHVRSASRVGHSDFGANRKRVERLRRALQAKL